MLTIVGERTEGSDYYVRHGWRWRDIDANRGTILIIIIIINKRDEEVLKGSEGRKRRNK